MKYLQLHMYDRKKITLFILLIATVILGGVSLYLATQINQSQAPDDSEAADVNDDDCRPINSVFSGACLQTTESACKGATSSITSGTCCSFNEGSSQCNSKAGAASYCSQVNCGNFASNETTCTTSSVTLLNICTWHGAAPATPCTVPGTTQTVSVNGSFCGSSTSYRNYTCSSAGAAATGTSQCCDGRTWNGSACVTTTGGGQTGTDNCTQGGQTITHGATSCIDGTNYSCSNGTVTPGGSCGTTTGGTTTGTPTCSNEAPIKAQLLTPKNNSVVNTASVTLSWNKNGSFGVNCAGNTNEYKVRVLVVGLNESCPASSGLSNVATIQAGTGDGDGNFSHNITVQDDTKVCWTIRKRNGALATDTGIRNFVVNLADTNPAPGDDTDDGSSSVIVDTGNVAGADSSLPATAIISDELDPLILGMILVIVGLTLYKFDFGRRKEEV